MFFCLMYSGRNVANFIPSGHIAIQAIVLFCQSVKNFIFHVVFKKHAMHHAEMLQSNQCLQESGVKTLQLESNIRRIKSLAMIFICPQFLPT